MWMDLLSFVLAMTIIYGAVYTLLMLWDDHVSNIKHIFPLTFIIGFFISQFFAFTAANIRGDRIDSINMPEIAQQLEALDNRIIAIEKRGKWDLEN